MEPLQDEYQEELQKVQDKDFAHDWVSSSGFLFYLSIATIVAFVFGAAYNLYTYRFDKSKPDNITIQESTLYTPKYSK